MRIPVYFTILTLCALPLHTQAKMSDWVILDEVQARFLSGVESIGEARAFDAALEVKLDEGWHSYWRVSGDSGLPPRFDWSGSENIQEVELSWPVPVRKNEGGFYTFGYDSGTTFPLNVKVQEPSVAAKLHVKAQLLICKEICIPQQFEASLEIPAGDGATSESQKWIQKAKEAVPVIGDTPGLKIDTVVVGPDALVVSAFSQNGFEDVDLFPVSEAVVLTLPPQIAVDEDESRKAMIRIPVTNDIENLRESLEGQSLSLTLVSGDRAIEKIVEY